MLTRIRDAAWSYLKALQTSTLSSGTVYEYDSNASFKEENFPAGNSIFAVENFQNESIGLLEENRRAEEAGHNLNRYLYASEDSTRDLSLSSASSTDDSSDMEERSIRADHHTTGVNGFPSFSDWSPYQPPCEDNFKFAENDAIIPDNELQQESQRSIFEISNVEPVEIFQPPPYSYSEAFYPDLEGPTSPLRRTRNMPQDNFGQEDAQWRMDSSLDSFGQAGRRRYRESKKGEMLQEKTVKPTVLERKPCKFAPVSNGVVSFQFFEVLHEPFRTFMHVAAQSTSLEWNMRTLSLSCIVVVTTFVQRPLSFNSMLLALALTSFVFIHTPLSVILFRLATLFAISGVFYMAFAFGMHVLEASSSTNPLSVPQRNASQLSAPDVASSLLGWRNEAQLHVIFPVLAVVAIFIFFVIFVYFLLSRYREVSPSTTAGNSKFLKNWVPFSANSFIPSFLEAVPEPSLTPSRSHSRTIPAPGHTIRS